MKNKEVIEAFISKIKGKSSSLKSTGLSLYSYNTCIAEWDLEYNCILFNTTYYSNTTSRHQNLLKKNLPIGVYIVNVTNVERHQFSLKDTINSIDIK